MSGALKATAASSAVPSHRRASKRRATDAIAQEIEPRIRSGSLASDAPLPAEREVMKRFGSSRTVIRDLEKALTANREATSPSFMKRMWRCSVVCITFHKGAYILN